MKIMHKKSIIILVGISTAMLSITVSVILSTEVDILIKFKTFKEFRKACLSGANGVIFCTNPIDSEFSGNPNYAAAIKMKYFQRANAYISNRYRFWQGDSVRLLLIGVDDTVFAKNSFELTLAGNDTLDFGKVDTASKLDPTHISKFINDSVLTSDPIFFPTSMISLIASPGSYSFKKVNVSGYLRLENENFAIYLNKDDYDERRIENSIFIRFGDGDVNLGAELSKRFESLDGELVLINGVFETCPNKCGAAGYLKFVLNIVPLTKIIKPNNRISPRPRSRCVADSPRRGE